MNAETALINAAGFSSIAAFWMFTIGTAFKSRAKSICMAAMLILILCFVCVSVSILARGMDASRFPIANFYESLLLFCWGLLLVFLILVNRQTMPQLGWLTALAVSTVFLYASWLPAGQHEINPLTPALVSYWRVIHVPPLMLSYAFLIVSGLLSIVHLWCARRPLTAIACLISVMICLCAISIGTLKLAPVGALPVFFWPVMLLSSLAAFAAFWRERKIPYRPTPQCDLLDSLSQKSIAMGFPLLTFGIISGALWANHAWGNYWTWDPKESMSLATWLCYAAYLHLRARYSISNDALSLCAVMGLLLTILTYLGFTFLSMGGLHTYGNLG